MSQLDFESTTIDGKTYEMQMLAPMTSHRLLFKVVKMVGPSLGPVLDIFFSKTTSDKSFMDREIPTDFFNNAASALFGSLDNTVIEEVIATFKEKTTVDGVMLSKIFDVHFKGELHNMYQWVAWGMKAQWGKSFDALVKDLPFQGVSLEAKASQSQNT